jgi:hypothetical protein
LGEKFSLLVKREKNRFGVENKVTGERGVFIAPYFPVMLHLVGVCEHEMIR